MYESQIDKPTFLKKVSPAFCRSLYPHMMCGLKLQSSVKCCFPPHSRPWSYPTCARWAAHPSGNLATHDWFQAAGHPRDTPHSYGCTGIVMYGCVALWEKFPSLPCTNLTFLQVFGEIAQCGSPQRLAEAFSRNHPRHETK